MADAVDTPAMGDFIRSHRDQIIAHWELRARQLPHARPLGRLSLLDHIPELLDLMVELVEKGADVDTLKGLPEEHALQRLDIGFDLESVASEYGMLRRSILELFDEKEPKRVRLREISKLNHVIDTAITRAVVRYAEMKERTLLALDLITEAGLGGKPLSVLLPRLLSVLLDTVESLDSAAIYLREGDTLRVHACRTRRNVPTVSATFAMGESLVGMIAEKKEALEQRASKHVRERGLRTLFGVPLMEGAEVIGVVEVGSVSAPEFSHEDKALFRTMGSRAATLIYQARLRESEHTERERAKASLLLVSRNLEDRERLMGILAHDIRNPLTVISLTAERLQEKARLDEVTTQAAARIAEGARRMTRMVADLLDFTRRRMGRSIRLKLAPTDLAAVCERARLEIAMSHPDRQITLDASDDCNGVWDSDRVTRAIENLLGNALQYSPDDTPVRMRLRRQGDEMLLEITNQGAPLPAETQARLFEPYLSGELQGDSGGLGLGLFIVRQVVLAHEGTVGVHSNDDGITFAVRLPCHPGKDDARKAGDNAPPHVPMH